MNADPTWLTTVWPIVNTLGWVIAGLFWWTINKSLREVDDMVRSVTDVVRAQGVYAERVDAHMEQDRKSFDAYEKRFDIIMARFDSMNQAMLVPRVDEVARAQIATLIDRVNVHRREIDDLRRERRNG